jgi:hypothetical protein
MIREYVGIIGMPLELRIVKSAKGAISGYYDDVEQLIADVEYIVENQGTFGKIETIYATLNEIDPKLLARSHNRFTLRAKNTTSDLDITRRWWLLIDCDPKRPSGISSTDDEHNEAIETLASVKTYLSGLGFPSPMVGDSGNGGHLLYRIDLPNTRDTANLLQKFLTTLAGRFDNDRVSIDKSVFNASRICKLYGTMAKKGDEIAGRVHRIAKILEKPEQFAVVGIETIRSVIGETDKILGSENGNAYAIGVSVSSEDRADWVESKLQRWGLEHQEALPYRDGFKWSITECPFCGESDGSAVVTLIDNKVGYKCHHNRCVENGWIKLRKHFEPNWIEGDDAELREQEALVENIVGARLREKTLSGDFDGCQTFDLPEEASLYEASKTPPKEKKQPAFATLYTPAEMMKLDLKPRFLIKDIMVAGQPMVMGGRSKTMKTTIACDLVISLASGTSFLGKFPASKQVVGFWSGESGSVTIRETMLRICKARNIDFADCSLFQSFNVPKLSTDDHLKLLATIIQQKKMSVAVIDPLYLSLLAGNSGVKSSDLFAMGSVLQPVTELGQALDCTFVLLHHFRKGGFQDNGEPAGLEELSQSGIAEWARQWILLQRREAYKTGGNHALWMRTGGSVGHAGLWGVDIEEGMLDLETFEGRHWSVKVTSQHEVIEETKEKKQAEKLEKEQQAHAGKEEKVLKVLEMYPKGITKNKIRTCTRIGNEEAHTILVNMEEDGVIEQCKLIAGNRECDGWKLCSI